MILDKIVQRKREALLIQKEKESIYDIKEKIKNMKEPPSFYDAIAKKGLSIIGEIKKASPSKGLIREDFNPVEIASEYEVAVDAISVLTEEDFFMGKPEYLREVSKTVSLPTLRKDFIIDEFQIYEARELGASCILLIVAILEQEKLLEYIRIAESIKMDALVEAHTEEEVERAIAAGAKIIGINNRNLKDFSVDFNSTIKLKAIIPEGILVISESGIENKEQIKILKKAAIDGVLVGESFMKSGSIKNMAREFKGAYED
ncbi:indole-3-glycerol phosphate synthase [Clostridium homopropionicum DSM 5847]|uniref:Indole-3-glycerol phosphate synthase n=1 Tax=Clostridium homopropionicum DSM 5847 TaxID=1121318 RepID=A0A0L6ZAH2_9CLOT|nr:indole-3-glycerol phosphate synthase TrpC [Clostridium homopropionicum]KOA19976.1 indole-3-glycerol phosphate synthase [Clostridium homopropionicum DSM 5847]SFG63753.1 indole-3-glycerol phosphate synthase [Clostridium homopropionicum]